MDLQIRTRGRPMKGLHGSSSCMVLEAEIKEAIPLGLLLY
jgi:hypothetical protein